jgi:parallel beta-helix repeat protein
MANPSIRDVASMLPSDWATKSGSQRIAWFNENSVTPDELAIAGIPDSDIDAFYDMGFKGGATRTASDAQVNVQEAFGISGVVDVKALNRALILGGTFYFPAGTYTFSSALNIPSNVTLIGDGAGETVFLAGENYSPDMPLARVIHQSSSVNINGVTFDGGNNPRGSRALVEIRNVSDVNFANSGVQNTPYTGVDLGGSQNVTIQNSVFANTGNPQSTKMGGPAIYAGGEGQYQSKNINVVNNTFKDNNWSAAYFMPDGGQFSNNTCVNNGESTLFMNHTGKNVTIANNVIDGSRRMDISGSGLELGGQNLQVYGNKISNCAADGISLTDVSNSVIKDNAIFNNGQESSSYLGFANASGIGVHTTSNVSNNVIQGNSIYDDQQTPTQQYAIGGWAENNSSFQNSTISDNSVYGNAKGAVLELTPIFGSSVAEAQKTQQQAPQPVAQQAAQPVAEQPAAAPSPAPSAASGSNPFANLKFESRYQPTGASVESGNPTEQYAGEFATLDGAEVQKTYDLVGQTEQDTGQSVFSGYSKSVAAPEYGQGFYRTDVYDTNGKYVSSNIHNPGEDKYGLRALSQLAVMAVTMNPAIGAVIGGSITTGLGISASAATNAFIGNTVINTVLNGGDIESAVKSSVASWAGAQAGQLAGETAKTMFSNPEGIKLISNVANQATRAVVLGQDVETAALNTLVAGAVDYGTAKIPGFDSLPDAVKSTIKQSISAAVQGQDIDAGAMLANAAKEGLLAYGLNQIPQFKDADARTQSFITTMLRSGIDGGDLSESAVKWAIGQAQQELQKVFKAGPALDELKKAGIISDASYYGLDDRQKELVDRLSQQKDPKAAAAQYINEQTTTPEEIRQFYKQITGKDATDADAELLSTFTGMDEATAKVGLDNQIRANIAVDEMRFDELNRVFNDPQMTDQDLINVMKEYNITPAFVEKITGQKYDDIVRQMDARFMSEDEVVDAFKSAREAAGLEPRDPTPDEIRRYTGLNAGAVAQIQADTDREATTFDGSTFGSMKSAMEAAKAQGYNNFIGPDGKTHMVSSPVVAIQAGAFDGTTFGSVKAASDAAREAGKTTFVGPDEQHYMVLDPAQEGAIKDEIKQTKTFGQAFADARAKLGPGRTFEWTNPETGQTKTYNTYTATELYDGSRAGSKTDAAILAHQNGKTMFQYDGKIYNIPAGSLDNVGNQNRAEARRLVEANATAISNEQAAALEKKLQTKKLGDLDGVSGAVANLFGLSLQGLGEQVRYFATAGAAATGGNINNYYDRVGAAMVQLGESLTSRSLDQQKSSAEAGMRDIAKADFKDQPLMFAKLARDNFGWWLSENGKEIVQEFAPYATAIGVGTIAATGGASAPVVATLAAGSSAIVDGLEAFGSGVKEAYETLRKQGVPEEYARSQAIKNGLMHALVVTPVEFLADKLTLGALTSSLTGGIKAYMAKNLQATVAQTVGEWIETVGQGLSTKITTLDRAMTVDDLKQINVESIFAMSLGGGTTASILAGGAVVDSAVVAKDKLGQNVTLQELLSGTRDVDLNTLNPNAVIGQNAQGQNVTLGSLSAVAIDQGFTPATLNESLPSSFTTDNNIVLSRDALGNDITLGDVFSGQTPAEQARTVIQDYVGLGLTAKTPTNRVVAVNPDGTVTVADQTGNSTTVRAETDLKVGDSVNVDPNRGTVSLATSQVVSVDSANNTATVKSEDGATRVVSTTGDVKVGDTVNTNQVSNTATVASTAGATTGTAGATTGSTVGTVVDTAGSGTVVDTTGATTGATAGATTGATAGATSGAATDTTGATVGTVVDAVADTAGATNGATTGATADAAGSDTTSGADITAGVTADSAASDTTQNTGTVIAVTDSGDKAVVELSDGTTAVVGTPGGVNPGDSVTVDQTTNTASITGGGNTAVTDAVVQSVNTTNGTATVVTADGTKTIVDTGGTSVAPGAIVNVNTSTATVVPTAAPGPIDSQAVAAPGQYVAPAAAPAPVYPVNPRVTSQADLNAYVINRYKSGDTPSDILMDLYSFGYTRDGIGPTGAMQALTNSVAVAEEVGVQPGVTSVADLGSYVIGQLSAGKTLDQVKSGLTSLGYAADSTDVTRAIDVAKAKRPDFFPQAPTQSVAAPQVPTQQYKVLSIFPDEGFAVAMNSRDQSSVAMRYEPGVQAGTVVQLRPQDIGIRDPLTGELKFGATTGSLAVVISRNGNGTYNVQDSSGKIYAVAAPAGTAIDSIIEVDPVAKTVVTAAAPTPAPAPAPTPAPAPATIALDPNKTSIAQLNQYIDQALASGKSFDQVANAMQAAGYSSAYIDQKRQDAKDGTATDETDWALFFKQREDQARREEELRLNPPAAPTQISGWVLSVDAENAVIQDGFGNRTLVTAFPGMKVGGQYTINLQNQTMTNPYTGEVTSLTGPAPTGRIEGKIVDVGQYGDTATVALANGSVVQVAAGNPGESFTFGESVTVDTQAGTRLAPAYKVTTNQATVVATNETGTKAIVESQDGTTAIVDAPFGVTTGDTVAVDPATNTAVLTTEPTPVETITEPVTTPSVEPTTEPTVEPSTVVAVNNDNTLAVVQSPTGETSVVQTSPDINVGDSVTVDPVTNTATKADAVVNTVADTAIDLTTDNQAIVVATNDTGTKAIVESPDGTTAIVDTPSGVTTGDSVTVDSTNNTATTVEDTTVTDAATQTDTTQTAVVVAVNDDGTKAVVETNDGNVKVVETVDPVNTGDTVSVDPTTNTATKTDVAVDGNQVVNTDTGVAVDTATGVATNPNTGIEVDTNTGVVVNPDANTAVDTSANTATTVNPDTNTQTNVDTSTGTTTTVDAATGTETVVDPTTNTQTTVDPNANTQTATDVTTGTTTTVDANTGTQTTVDPTTNTQTTTDPNANTQTSVDNNTGVTTTVDANTGTQTAVDAATNTQTTVDPNAGVQTTVDPNANTQTVTDTASGITTTVDANTGTQTTVDPTSNTQTAVDLTTNTQTSTDAGTKTNIDEPEIPPADPRIAQLQERIDQLVQAGLDETAATNAAMSELTGQLATLTQAQTAQELAAAKAAEEAARKKRMQSGLQMLAPAAGKPADVLPTVSPLQTSGAAKFISPLAAFLSQVERNDYTPTPRQQQPMTPSQPMEQPDRYAYGKEQSIDELLDPYGERKSEEAPAFKAGGLATPLFAMGTRYGQYAKGGLNVVHHSGKARVDFRRGDAVTGPGDGQSDDIPAMLADGEFVFPADVVAALGNGSTKAGSDKLYDMMHSIRAHARSSGPKDLPPPAKSPLEYLKKTSKQKSARG